MHAQSDAVVTYREGLACVHAPYRQLIEGARHPDNVNNQHTGSFDVERGDRRVVANLLHEDGAAIRQRSLPRLSQDRVEWLCPSLKAVVQACAWRKGSHAGLWMHDACMRA